MNTEQVMKKLSMTEEEVGDLFSAFTDFILEFKKQPMYEDEDSYNLYAAWWSQHLSEIAPWDADCDIEYARVFLSWIPLLQLEEDIEQRVVERLEGGIHAEMEVSRMIY